MITVNHLSRTVQGSNGQPFHVLRDVSFHVDRGEFVGIIGPSGAGKSTLLRVLDLLDPPTSGSIVVDGLDITAPGAHVDLLRQKVGIVFQHCNLFPHLTILGNITLVLTKVQHLSQAEAHRRAMDTLGKVGLAGRADEYPDKLSGGQQQRAAIARTLALQPKILLLDEPTSALDPTMESEITGVLRLLAKEGLTMLFVTQKMRLAHKLTQRILFLDRGELIADAPTQQLFNNPSNPFIQTFLFCIRSLTFDITTRTFDFYDMMSQIRQFCIRQAIANKMDTLIHIVEEMLLLVQNYSNGVHIEIRHGEVKGDTSVVFTHRGATVSPLERPEADELAVMIIRGMSREVHTDVNADGVTITFSV